MSDDINPTRSPTLTDLLQGGEDKTEQAGYDLAAFRLETFNRMVEQANAYQVVLERQGSITEEECTSTIQGFAHIQSQMIEADSNFCCEDCGEGSTYFFSNDDGLCAWCCAARSDEVSSGQNPENEAEKIGHLPMGVHNCCDWHSQAESTKEQPCAAWQGGSNYAPNFETVEGEHDYENPLFLSHVEHLLEGQHLLEILEGWVDLSCPACSATLEFSRDGNHLHADCFHCEVGSSLNVVMS